MPMREVNIVAAPGWDTSDLCARSGLSSTPTTGELTVYTTRFPEMAEYYTRIFGEEKIRFKTDDILVIHTIGDSELLIQEVPSESLFEKLSGKQALGFVVDDDAFAGLTAATGAKDVKEIAASGPALWAESVYVAFDPDGNVIQFMLERKGK